MPKREFQGFVVSDKADKTVVVQVEQMVQHPKYKKFIKRTRKFVAHDEKNEIKTGDTVVIQECRPISKRKSWLVISNNKV
jgi:small subunit ribosomal protein S17